MIKIKNLKKYYGPYKGVEDISIEVKEKDIFGFVGPNGAGKSTTIRIIMGLIFPTSGYVEVMGETSVEGLTKIRKDIGYLPGEANFYGSLTVKELLEYGCRLKGRGLENIKSLAEKLQLDLKKRIDELSLGNRKKVGIINAVAHEPKLIILDEPTSGLDPVMQHIFFNILNDLNKKGSTLFFSSHILSEVQSFCKKVAVIKDGLIVASGTMQEISGKNLKEVKLTFLDKAPKIDKIDGLANVNISGHFITFDYSGKVDDLLVLITKLKPHDINIENADLERLIMHYYL